MKHDKTPIHAALDKIYGSGNIFGIFDDIDNADMWYVYVAIKEKENIPVRTLKKVSFRKTLTLEKILEDIDATLKLIAL